MDSPATITAGAHGAHLAPIDGAELAGIEHLLDQAFGADRQRRTAYRLREGVAFAPAASCAAYDERRLLVGSLQSWPLELADDGGGVTPLWLVGPIAVAAERRGEGIARAMLRRALAAIDMTGFVAVLIGDPEYYGPFGFSSAATGGWRLPGPFERHRLLARTAPNVPLPASGLLRARR